MKTLIGISGKLGSGKDTVGVIIQYLYHRHIYERDFLTKVTEQNFKIYRNSLVPLDSSWKIKKFADKLKDMVCLLIGCTREELENHDFKSRELGEEWTRYGYADGHNDHYRNGVFTKSMNVIPCDEERYERERRVNWQTAYKSELTPRLLLQLLGTECGRQIIHPNIWVNSLFTNYRPTCKTYCARMTQADDASCSHELDCDCMPNWIVTDMRFPNELQAIKDRDGISIRVVRNAYYTEDEMNHYWKDSEDGMLNVIKCSKEKYSKHGAYVHFLKELYPNQHESETALDTYQTDYTIYNNGSIEDLIEQVKEILIKEEIINGA